MSGNPPRKVTGRSFLRLPSARVAIVVLLGIAVLTVFGSTLAPQNPLTINANALFQGPSAHHWLGTDYLGRDVLSRLMAGTRLSVSARASPPCSWAAGSTSPRTGSPTR
jgi:peptide/nickel transport system permease protein